jgi:hypothetical protein
VGPRGAAKWKNRLIEKFETRNSWRNPSEKRESEWKNLVFFLFFLFKWHWNSTVSERILNRIVCFFLFLLAIPLSLIFSIRNNLKSYCVLFFSFLLVISLSFISPKTHSCLPYIDFSTNPYSPPVVL